MTKQRKVDLVKKIYSDIATGGVRRLDKRLYEPEPSGVEGVLKEFEQIMLDNNLVSAFSGEDFVKDNKELKSFIQRIYTQADANGYERGKKEEWEKVRKTLKEFAKATGEVVGQKNYKIICAKVDDVMTALQRDRK